MELIASAKQGHSLDGVYIAWVKPKCLSSLSVRGDFAQVKAVAVPDVEPIRLATFHVCRGIADNL